MKEIFELYCEQRRAILESDPAKQPAMIAFSDEGLTQALREGGTIGISRFNRVAVPPTYMGLPYVVDTAQREPVSVLDRAGAATLAAKGVAPLAAPIRADGGTITKCPWRYDARGATKQDGEFVVLWYRTHSSGPTKILMHKSEAERLAQQLMEA